MKKLNPLVIIGAARSGTNMLRDVLTSLPEFTTWACDEINYIWRHGNVRYPTDEFPPELARPSVRSYIRSAFQKISEGSPEEEVVEKTCANSLRVAFVNRVLPEARFVEIVRDGRDVVVSAEARWTATVDIPYLAKKAKYIPMLDLPYYGTRYTWNRIYRLFSRRKRLAFWGPRFDGLDDALERHSLEEVCALQWRRCVERSGEDLQQIDPARVYRIRYEDLVAHPEAELRRLLEFASVELNRDLKSVVEGISGRSVGQWRAKLDPATRRSVELLIGDTLKQHGYAT